MLLVGHVLARSWLSRCTGGSQGLLTALTDDVSRLNADTAAVGDGTGEGAEGRDNGLSAADIVPAGAAGHIVASEEIRLPLLRHWTLLDALFCSQDVAAALGTW